MTTPNPFDNLPPELNQIFGNLKKPENLTEEQKIGLKFQELARKFPKS